MKPRDSAEASSTSFLGLCTPFTAQTLHYGQTVMADIIALGKCFEKGAT